MKNIIMIIALSLVSTFASARVFLPSCHNYTQNVSYSYVSCVNRNFSEISRELTGAFITSCYNYGDDVSFSFTSCIDRNLRSAAYELDVIAPYCTNFGTTLSHSYQYCVNNAMRALERALNDR